MKVPGKQTKPYRLGIALSGGGARGFAHIGALKAIRDLGLKPDIIAGVSAGSVVSAFYAAGLLDGDRDALLNLFNHSRFSKFAAPKLPNDGLFTLNRFEERMRELLPVANLEELPLKTLICATDLDGGIKVAWDSGPIAPRVVASCSIPIVFEPKVIDGCRYIDGGVLRNLPAWAIRHQCATLIGINCSPIAPYTPAKGIMGIAMRSYTLMAKTNVTADLEMCDHVVSLTETAAHQVFDLHDLELMIESGYLQAIRALKDFKSC